MSPFVEGVVRFPVCEKKRIRQQSGHRQIKTVDINVTKCERTVSAGLHSARGAMHGVSGALRVREPAIGGCELAGTPPPRAADDLEDRRYLVKTRILPCCEKLSVLFVIVTGTVE